MTAWGALSGERWRGLPGYSGATAPDLHRTSLDPHHLGAIFVWRVPDSSCRSAWRLEGDGEGSDGIDVPRGHNLHEDLPARALDP